MRWQRLYVGGNHVILHPLSIICLGPRWGPRFFIGCAGCGGRWPATGGRRPGDLETWRPAAWRPGDRRPGGLETWRPGDLETWRPGDRRPGGLAAWRPGGRRPAAWRPGDLAAWRPGGLESNDFIKVIEIIRLIVATENGVTNPP